MPFSRSAAWRGFRNLLTYQVSQNNLACDFPCLENRMSTLIVSSKGQIVLPAALRRRLGLGAGARVEVFEEPDGLRLRVVRPVVTADLAGMAGMVKAPARGVPRHLEDFDPASLVKRSRRGKS
jgi:AbrB family looped-hinge helix DNA binding protein